MKRNASIELFRILLMFGIVYLHVAILPECGGAVFPKNLLVSCVPAFMIVSGYFGIRFRLSKLVRLYALAVFVSLIIPAIGGAFLRGDYWREVLSVWNMRSPTGGLGGFWFLHAYAVVMVLAIPVERILAKPRTPDTLRIFSLFAIAFGIVVFGWGNLMRYRCLAPFVPFVQGLQDFSPMTLFGAYLIGRCIGLSQISPRRDVLVVTTIALVGLICATGLYLTAYNSPISLALAVVVFLLFKSIPVSATAEKIILFVAPSMFAVYLIHGYVYLSPYATEGYMALGRAVQHRLSDVPFAPSVFVTATALFALALCIDMIRRGCCLLVCRQLDWCCQVSDRASELCVEWMVRRISR